MYEEQEATVHQVAFLLQMGALALLVVALAGVSGLLIWLFGL